MLLGIGCQQRYNLSTQETQQAVGFVNQLGFVALMSGMHAYEKSVCLLHARFGGRVYDFEVPSYSDEPWVTYQESLLDNYRDEADEAVYAAAVARFESDWERNPQAERCLQAVARRAEGRVR